MRSGQQDAQIITSRRERLNDEKIVLSGALQIGASKYLSEGH